MAHSDKFISKILIPGTTEPYEIHDAQAIHNIEELGLSAAMVFKGTKATYADLPSTGNKQGDVWHVTATDFEYVWTEEGEWEELGRPYDVASSDHTHSFSASTTATLSGNNTLSGSATVTGTNGSSSVTGSATVTGTNASSSVSASGDVTIPTVSKTEKYLKMSNGSDSFVKSYSGATNKLVTTSVTPAGAATSVVNGITPATTSITGVSGSTTASKATAGTAVAVAKVGTAVKVPNVTGNASVTASKISANTDVSASKVTTSDVTGVATNFSAGTLPSWSASVTDDGILSFSFGAGTLPSASSTTITEVTGNTTVTASKVTASDVSASKVTLGTELSIAPAVSNGDITPYTFEDITVPKAATATTVVTDVESSSTNVATVGTAVSVATGKLASTGTGDTVMTGLGTASTGSALTSASLAAGAATDTYVGDAVTIGSKDVEVEVSGTAAAQTWTQATGTISGTAAAQTWTQKTGTASVSGNVSVSGTVAHSGTTSQPQ